MLHVTTGLRELLADPIERLARVSLGISNCVSRRNRCQRNKLIRGIVT